MVGKTISHYKILEKIGEGGMGVVYKAQDTKLDRFVALKFLPAYLNEVPSERKRLIHEAQAASALDHPNICTVHEIDEVEGTTFISFGYVEGRSLRQRLGSGPLDVKEAVNISRQVAQGLRAAHEKGIIHRDVKSSNIMVTEHGQVKIMDFGIAKRGEGTLSAKPGQLLGTLPYMSPEQIRGETVDHRTDIWSFGVVLYEMLTGRLPFKSDHQEAVVYLVLNQDATDPELLRSGVSGSLSILCKRCLAKDRGLRPQSMEEVLNLLDATSAIHRTTSQLWKTLPPAKRRYVGYGFGLAVVVAAALIWFSMADEAMSLSPMDYIVIADVANSTADSVFNHSLTEAIRVSLRQSPRINLLPRERISDALRRMQAPMDRPLDEPTALAVARREGARVVVAGNIEQFGSRYVLSCKIVDAVKGETIRIPRRDVSGIEHILTELDRLCDLIRENLGESLREISNYTIPLEKVTTSSLQALELYSRGDILERQGKYAEAALLKEKAVILDSLFTIAVSDLSYIHRKLGNDSLALFYHNRVPSLIARVSDREKYYIMSMYYGPNFELDFQKTFQNVQQLVLQYPNSAEGFGLLGYNAMLTGDTKAALEANQRCLDLDSVYAGTMYNNSGYALALAGRAGEALAQFRRSKQIRPTYHTIDMYVARTFLMAEEFDSAQAVLLGILPLAGPVQKMQAHGQLASLHHFRGRLVDASRECRKGLELSRSLGRRGDEAYFHFLLGEIAGDQGASLVFDQEMRLAAELSISPFIELPLVAGSLARNGRIERAEATLKLLGVARSGDPYFLRRRSELQHYARGEILLARNLTREAEREFQAVGEVHCGDPFYLLSQLGIARCASTDSSAEERFMEILEKRGEVVMGVILSHRNYGLWASRLWPEASLELTKSQTARGKLSEAKTNVDRLMRIWQNADPSYHNAQAARHLARLVKGDQ
ncbi:MAG TPA: hypothetical protein DCP63_04015 [Bacteroidetes bacterium]|nr:hypothetical protein [Bacteroidota bacterium]